MNQKTFAVSLLKKLSIEPTPENVKALVGWENAEGGNWKNDAKYNPLNTTQPEPGAGNTGTQGNIKVYKNWPQGVTATAQTLENGRYGNILSALKSGKASQVGDAIAASPWGTGALAKQVISGTPASSVPTTTSSPAPSQPTTATPAPAAAPVDHSALIAQYLASKGQPDSTINLALGLLGDTPAPTPTPVAAAKPTPKTAPSRSSSGTATFDGKPVAAWIAPVLTYARQNGWKGTVTSGYRTDKAQTAIYNSGVRPAAKPISEGGSGSNHERTGFLQGAVDVTDAPTLSKILKQKGSRLKWAGAKDPVHFSVPSPDGSY